ncbi:hypothetical protein [Pseudomonas subflava]|uniref:hypothetical protein n=1 Tax=Pseudomonas subflava TaxID=2952933 RepID=UPI00207AE9B2|nr:hypothetical protein [Pseudomonas subflava]
MSAYVGILYAGVLIIWTVLMLQVVRYVLHRHFLLTQQVREFNDLLASYRELTDKPSPLASVTGPPVAGDGGDTG